MPRHLFQKPLECPRHALATALCMSLLSLLLPRAAARASDASQNTVRLTYSEIRYYETAKPYTTWTPEQLLHAKLGLKGLKLAAGQEQLPAILQKTGANVEAFFHDFTNTESVETISETHLNPATGMASAGLAQEEKFNYLFLAASGSNDAGIEEYRTDSKGRRVDIERTLPGASFVTEGFASLPAVFLPSRQSESTYRYLGEQEVDKRETLVLAFAQQPRAVRSVEMFKAATGSTVLLLQGIAWIAPPDYQILRLRCDLLAPRADVGLEQETTDIRFKEIHFKQSRNARWLPVDVVVTIGWQSGVFQNHHHYSGFKMFEVSTADQRVPKRKKKR